jgi:hypothetical protein
MRIYFTMDGGVDQNTKNREVAGRRRKIGEEIAVRIASNRLSFLTNSSASLSTI